MNINGLKSSVLRYYLVIFLLAVIIYTAYILLFPARELPVLSPADFYPELVDKSLRNKQDNHVIADFNLINQNGRPVTQNDYKGKIYVTDFFFTSCKAICPVMTNNMEKLQDVFIDDSDIKFLSISVTPERDSVTVLKEYAERHGVIDSKWNITTGDKKHIYELARKSYFAVTNKGDGGLQDFIHTPNFILVDTKKRIRGIYTGTEDSEIERLISDIKILKGQI